MANENPGNQPVLYDSTPLPGWTEKVENWPWILFQDDGPIKWYAKQGICPRCGHQTVQIFPTGFPYVPGVAAAKLGEEAASILEERLNYGPPKTITFECRCSVAHPDHPAHDGCGQYAQIPSWSATPESQP